MITYNQIGVRTGVHYHHHTLRPGSKLKLAYSLVHFNHSSTMMDGRLWLSVSAFCVLTICTLCVNIKAEVIIEQTRNYTNTWRNISTACSLLGTGLTGNAAREIVTVGNVEDIRGTGWISAHVEENGTMHFAGCTYSKAKRTPLKLTDDRIPQCIYFCNSTEFFLHRDFCYCPSIASHRRYHQDSCTAVLCDDVDTLLCGYAENVSDKCMCRYEQRSKVSHLNRTTRTDRRNQQVKDSQISNNTLVIKCPTDSMITDIENKNGSLIFENAWLHDCTNNTCIWKTTQDNCTIFWDGTIPRKLLYWGHSGSNIASGKCVAMKRVPAQPPMLLLLPCTTMMEGICLDGTRQYTTTIPKQAATLTMTLSTYTTPEDITSSGQTTTTTNVTYVHPSTRNDNSASPSTSHETTVTHDNLITSKHTNSVQRSTPLVVTDDDTVTLEGRHSVGPTVTSDVSADTDDVTPSLTGPIIGGVVSFLVLVVVSVVVLVVCLRTRSRSTQSKQGELNSSRELDNLSRHKQSQDRCENNYVHDGCRKGDDFYSDVSDGVYDSLQNKHKNDENETIDQYDHATQSGHSIYGRLHQNVPSDKARDSSMYDNSDRVNQSIGHTYDTFRTGQSPEAGHSVYYDHTGVEDCYGRLRRDPTRAGQLEESYDTLNGLSVSRDNSSDYGHLHNNKHNVGHSDLSDYDHI